MAARRELRKDARVKRRGRGRPASYGRHPGGAPRILTAELALELCEAIAAAVPLKTAAAMNGIGESTLHDWRRGCQNDPRTNPTHRHDDACEYRVERLRRVDRRIVRTGQIVKFSALVDEAIASGEARLVLRIASASVKDPRAAMYLLERRYPDNWRQAGELDLNVRGLGPAVVFNLVASDRELTDEQRAQLAETVATRWVSTGGDAPVAGRVVDADAIAREEGDELDEDEGPA